MAEEATPLSDEERAELEALRAEKKAREEAEAARKEREELAALRAEKAEAEAREAHKQQAKALEAQKQQAVARSAQKPAASQTSRPATKSTQVPQPQKPEEMTFGQRMVSTGELDDDGIPAMAPAQKIIIGIAIVAVIVFAVYTYLSNTGAL